MSNTESPKLTVQPRRDKATVSGHGKPIVESIDGVKIRELATVIDYRSDLLVNLQRERRRVCFAPAICLRAPASGSGAPPVVPSVSAAVNLRCPLISTDVIHPAPATPSGDVCTFGKK
jgi:hypothetical protein